MTASLQASGDNGGGASRAGSGQRKLTHMHKQLLSKRQHLTQFNSTRVPERTLSQHERGKKINTCAVEWRGGLSSLCIGMPGKEVPQSRQGQGAAQQHNIRWVCVSKFARVWTDLRQARAGCHAGTSRSPGGQQRPRKRTIEPVVERHPDRKPMRHADAVGTPISGQASRRADTRSAAGTRAGAKPWLHHSLPCTVHTCARRSRLLPADKHNLIRQIARAART